MAVQGGRERSRRRGRGRFRAALTAGDRPYVFVLLVLVVIVAAMAVGPLQVFTEAADRVDDLEDQRDRLRQEVEELEDRQQQLEDPDEVELLARSELGLVRPGEIPVVVVTPDREEAEATPDDEPTGRDAPWYRRLGRWLSDQFGEDG